MNVANWQIRPSRTAGCAHQPLIGLHGAGQVAGGGVQICQPLPGRQGVGIGLDGTAEGQLRLLVLLQVPRRSAHQPAEGASKRSQSC